MHFAWSNESLLMAVGNEHNYLTIRAHVINVIPHQ
jgi:hypothetical protein